MYFEKRFLLYAFNKLSTLTGDPTKQGATQNVSAIRHLLATDAVLRETGLESVDCGQKNDQRKFIAQVNAVVSVFDGNYTTNFYSIKPHGGDCCIGSNFFSAGAVKKSDINPSLTFSYPDRGEGKELLSIKNSHIKPHANSYENLANYFPSPEYKAAFVIWLSRCFGEFNNIDNLHSDVRAYLSTIYSNKLVMALLPAEDEFNGFVNNFNDDKILADSLVEFVSADFQSLSAAETPVVEAMGRVRLNMELENYLAAIRTKPFILLAGISGTGKSRIVRQLARGCCPEKKDGQPHPLIDEQKPGNFELISVRPNWHDSTELMGYVTRITGTNNPKYVLTPFVKFLVKAWLHKDVPFFLCLDEMNLAPVEQYFAEYLSKIETRKLSSGEVVTDVLVEFTNEVCESAIEELLKPYKPAAGSPIPPEVTALQNAMKTDKGIRIPSNLVVMGTVNMDETTCSFSRKVLDRAMSFELNDVEDMYTISTDGDPNVAWGAFNNGVVNRAKQTYVTAENLYAETNATKKAANKAIGEKVLAYLKAINAVLDKTPFKVAYRTRNEMMLYCVERGGDLAKALDEVTSMKILSRIEGDENVVRVTNKLVESAAVAPTPLPTNAPKNLIQLLKLVILKQLGVVDGTVTNAAVAPSVQAYETLEGKYKICAAKLDEMNDRLLSGYTGFWR